MADTSGGGSEVEESGGFGDGPEGSDWLGEYDRWKKNQQQSTYKAAPVGEPTPVAAAPASSSGGSSFSVPHDAGSKSFTGPYSWAQDYAKGITKDYGSSFMDQVKTAASNLAGAAPYSGQTNQTVGGMMGALDQYGNTPDAINQSRDDYVKWWLASQQPFEQTTQPILEAMNTRGILNSAVTGGALGQAVAERSRSYNQALAEAGLNASNQLMNFYQNAPGVYESAASALAGLDTNWANRQALSGQLSQGAQDSINQLVGLGGRFSEGSQDLWGSILPYLLGG